MIIIYATIQKYVNTQLFNLAGFIDAYIWNTSIDT